MKMKKLFIFLTLLLSIFTLFACSNKNKLPVQNNQRTLKMDYFKNKFPNVVDLAIKQSHVDITNLDVKDFNGYNRASLSNEFLYYKKVTDEENTYSFYNLKEKTECKIEIKPGEALHKQQRASSNIIVIQKNDNTYALYSQKDGALLQTFEYDSPGDLVISYDFAKYNNKSIDKITYFDSVKKTTTVYYAYDYKLTTNVDDIKKATYNINEKEELIIEQQSYYYAIYYQNKLYDEIKKPLNSDNCFLLENNNILFQTLMQFDKDLIGDDFEHIKQTVEVAPGRFEVRTYVLKHYLYDFKTKKLNEIKLPYFIKSLRANRKNSEGERLYSNEKITNVVQVRFIDPKTKKLEQSLYSFVIDNNFKNHQFIEGIDDFETIKLNNNKALKKVDETYYLLNDKGETEFTFDKSYKVNNLIQDRYLVCGNLDTSSEQTFYDLNSFNSKNQTFKEIKAYLLSYDAFNEYLFKNENNDVFKLKDGELKKLPGKYYGIYNDNLLVTKDENNYYFFNLKGEELKTINTSLFIFSASESRYFSIGVGERLYFYRFNYKKDGEWVQLLITLIIKN